MLTAVMPFPQVYATYTNDELLEAFGTGPARLRRALEGLTEEQLRARPIAGKWTILEIALHVVDSELIGSGRIRLAFAQSGAGFFAYDQDRWADAFEYNAQSVAYLHEQLELLANLRRSSSAMFAQTADPEFTERFAVHPELGPITIRNILELYADHIDRHLVQIADRRALLGSPAAIEILLHTRLY